MRAGGSVLALAEVPEGRVSGIIISYIRVLVYDIGLRLETRRDALQSRLDKLLRSIGPHLAAGK